MDGAIRRLAGKVLHSKPTLFVRSRLNRLIFHGRRYECPICGAKLRKYLPYGRRNALLERMHVVGGGRREHGLCPVCGSLDRERLLYLFLCRETDIFSRPVRLLHVAPERPLERLFRASSRIEYITADKFRNSVAVKMDITSMPFPDMCFDAVLCNHVLEYVADEVTALKECYRVLKPGGWAIIQEQIAESLEITYENPALVSAADRLAEYGDGDHVRLYGRDYARRMERGGFAVKVFDWSTEPEGFGLPENRYGLLERESVFFLRRPL